jgi:hypothetical protein
MTDYTGFEVKIDNDDGTTTMLPLQTVSVYDVTNDEALDDLTTNADGFIEAGTLDVDAGTLIRFSFNRADGICGYSEQTTS